VLNLQLSPSLGVPIYRQIMDGVRELVAAGSLRPGDQLPSIREISEQLRINPSSAIKAYNELRHAGVIVQDQGRGTFVRDDVGVVRQTQRDVLYQQLRALVQRTRLLGVSDRELKRALVAVLEEQPLPGLGPGAAKESR